MDQLSAIKTSVDACTKCSLSNTRINPVAGSGTGISRIMIIGEAPGKKEDEKGEPFVGASGKLLNDLLESIHLERDDVFITNTVKCRPPNNRDPKKEEIKACSNYLKKQVSALQPKLILLLGRHAMYRFLPKELKISEVHGIPQTHTGISTEKQVYLPLYHPAYALYNGSYRNVLFEDFAKIPEILARI